MRNYEESLRYADLALALNSNLIDFNGDTDILPFNTTTTAPYVIKYNKETIFYAELHNMFVWSATRSLVDSTLYGSFHEFDLRKLAYFRVVNDDVFFKGNLTG